MAACRGGLVPKGPRREPPVTAAPKRSRRTESDAGAGAGVLRNAPGTWRTGVVVAMLCSVSSILSDTGRSLSRTLRTCPYLFKTRRRRRRRGATAGRGGSGGSLTVLAPCPCAKVSLKGMAGAPL